MKNSFFKIVGGFSLIIASLALVLAIILGFKAGDDFFSSANEDIRYPELSFRDFYNRNDNADQAESLSNSKNESGNSKEDEDYLKKRNQLLKNITKSFNEFASLTNQQSVNPEGLQGYLAKNFSEIMNREDYLIFLKELDDAASDLNKEGEEIAKLKPEDEKYVHWATDFIPWFIEAYISEFSKELQRINNEKLQTQSQKASSIATAGVAAGAFMSFVFFTLIVLLVQIERNTRK